MQDTNFCANSRGAAAVIPVAVAGASDAISDGLTPLRATDDAISDGLTPLPATDDYLSPAGVLTNYDSVTSVTDDAGGAWTRFET